MDPSAELKMCTQGGKPPMNNEENVWLRKQWGQWSASGPARQHHTALGPLKLSELSQPVLPWPRLTSHSNLEIFLCLCISTCPSPQRSLLSVSFSPGTYSDSSQRRLVKRKAPRFIKLVSYSLTCNSVCQVHLEAILFFPLWFSSEEGVFAFLKLATKHHIIYTYTKLYTVMHLTCIP